MFIDQIALHGLRRLVKYLVVANCGEVLCIRSEPRRFFEDFRLEGAAVKSPVLDGIFSAVTEFCNGNPLSDDCTVVELCYTCVE